MAITCTWEINGTQCKRDIADGYFTNVVYRVKAEIDLINTPVQATGVAF